MQRIRLIRFSLIASIVTPVLVVLFCVLFRREVGRPLYFSVYFAPAIGAFFLSISYRLLETKRYGLVRAFTDGLVILLCSLRATAPLVPMSGHMLFFVYAGLTIRSRLFRIIIALLIIQTSLIKLMIWRDYLSWSFGVLSGVPLAVVFARSPRRAPRHGPRAGAE